MQGKCEILSLYLYFLTPRIHAVHVHDNFSYDPPAFCASTISLTR